MKIIIVTRLQRGLCPGRGIEPRPGTTFTSSWLVSVCGQCIQRFTRTQKPDPRRVAMIALSKRFHSLCRVAASSAPLFVASQRKKPPASGLTCL